MSFSFSLMNNCKINVHTILILLVSVSINEVAQRRDASCIGRYRVRIFFSCLNIIHARFLIIDHHLLSRIEITAEQSCNLYVSRYREWVYFHTSVIKANSTMSYPVARRVESLISRRPLNKYSCWMIFRRWNTLGKYANKVISVNSDVRCWWNLGPSLWRFILESSRWKIPFMLEYLIYRAIWFNMIFTIFILSAKNACAIS
jgi:hypothetical protein